VLVIKNRARAKIRKIKKKVLTHSSTTSTTCFTYSGSFYGFFKINYDSKSNRDSNLDPRSLSLSVFSDSKRTIFVDFGQVGILDGVKFFEILEWNFWDEILECFFRWNLPKNIPWQVLQFCSRQYCWHIRAISLTAPSIFCWADPRLAGKSANERWKQAICWWPKNTGQMTFNVVKMRSIGVKQIGSQGQGYQNISKISIFYLPNFYRI